MGHSCKTKSRWFPIIGISQNTNRRHSRNRRSGPALNKAVGVLLLSLLSGCSLWKSLQPDPEQQLASFVAADMLGSMSGIEGFSPRDAPLQMMPAQSEFGAAVAKLLEESGYSLHSVPVPGGPRYVSYRIDSLHNESGSAANYRLSIGELSLSREYLRDGRNLRPVSPLTVSGIPGAAGTVSNSKLAGADLLNEDSDPFSAEVTTNSNATVPSLVQVQATEEEQAIAADLPQDLASVRRVNMYQTRRSNFAAFTRGYEAVEKTVLVFPNDSLHMTDSVRQKIRSMASLFEQSTDLFSVIGCSHGNTQLDNGNQLLALGRSKRVLQELVDAGVPANRILDEGCWAPVHFDEMMPRRGVVMALKRKAS